MTFSGIHSGPPPEVGGGVWSMEESQTGSSVTCPQSEPALPTGRTSLQQRPEERRDNVPAGTREQDVSNGTSTPSYTTTSLAEHLNRKAASGSTSLPADPPSPPMVCLDQEVAVCMDLSSKAKHNRRKQALPTPWPFNR